MKDYVMRFGKYTGVRFTSLKKEYILWLLDNCTEILRIDEQVELQRLIPTKTLLKYYSKPMLKVITRRKSFKRRSRKGNKV